MSGRIVYRSASPFAVGADLRRLVVGIGELTASNDARDIIVTHALGVCVAVCLFDPVSRVAGMLHFMLPDSRINLDRAVGQPALFADTGVPRLLQATYDRGLVKKRALVSLVGGGGNFNGGGEAGMMTGRRNVLAAKQVLWHHGFVVDAEDTGGQHARTVHLAVLDGRLGIFTGNEWVREI